MYHTLTFFHSIVRWLVLASLVCTIYRSARGYITNAEFSQRDDLFRHWTATIAHIQLVIGIMLYTQSPLVKYFWQNFSVAAADVNAIFFGLLHITLMLVAIVVITIASALAKRKAVDKDKFSILLLWLSVALVIIFIAIPWPFSPLANRPYFR